MFQMTEYIYDPIVNPISPIGRMVPSIPIEQPIIQY